MAEAHLHDSHLRRFESRASQHLKPREIRSNVRLCSFPQNAKTRTRLYLRSHGTGRNQPRLSEAVADIYLANSQCGRDHTSIHTALGGA